MSRALLALLGLALATMVQAQGPPTRVSAFTVEKATRFDEIPTPMQSLDPGKYHSGAASVSGFVTLNFPSVRAGKFKKGSLSVIVREKTITSVTLDAPTPKATKLLLKQLTDQFGDPYKLQSSQDRYIIRWFSDRNSKYEMEFQSDEDFTEASVLIEKAK